MNGGGLSSQTNAKQTNAQTQRNQTNRWSKVQTDAPRHTKNGSLSSNDIVKDENPDAQNSQECSKDLCYEKSVENQNV